MGGEGEVGGEGGVRVKALNLQDEDRGRFTMCVRPVYDVTRLHSCLAGRAYLKRFDTYARMPAMDLDKLH